MSTYPDYFNSHVGTYSNLNTEEPLRPQFTFPPVTQSVLNAPNDLYPMVDLDIELGSVSATAVYSGTPGRSIFRSNLVSPTTSTFSIDPRELQASVNVSSFIEECSFQIPAKDMQINVPIPERPLDLEESSSEDESDGNHDPVSTVAAITRPLSVPDSPKLVHAEGIATYAMPEVKAQSIGETVKKRVRRARQVKVESGIEDEPTRPFKETAQSTRTVSAPRYAFELLTSPPSRKRIYRRHYTTSPSADLEERPVSPSPTISSGNESSFSLAMPSSSDEAIASPAFGAKSRLASRQKVCKTPRSKGKKRSSAGRNPVARRTQNKASQCKYRNKRNDLYNLNQKTVITFLNTIGSHMGRDPAFKELHVIAKEYLCMLQDVSEAELLKVQERLDW